MNTKKTTVQTLLLIIDDSVCDHEELLNSLIKFNNSYKFYIFVNKKNVFFDQIQDKNLAQIFLCEGFKDKQLRNLYKKLCKEHVFNLILCNYVISKENIDFFTKYNLPVFLYLNKMKDEDILQKQGVLRRNLLSCSWITLANEALYQKLYKATVFAYKPVRLTIGSLEFFIQDLSNLYKKAYVLNNYEKEQINFLSKFGNFTLDDWQLNNNYLKKIEKFSTIKTGSFIKKYVKAWKMGMNPVRPLIGFHPGIYYEEKKLNLTITDPYMHYLQERKPEGPWKWSVLTKYKPISSKAKTLKIGLHIHAYFLEQIPAILNRLQRNEILPDLFISVKNQIDFNIVTNIFKNYPRPILIKIVENRGRDVTPFLHKFGQILYENYDIIGHIHTKGSQHLKKSTLKCWNDFLLNNLIGLNTTFKKGNSLDMIIDRFSENKKIGLMIADDNYFCHWNGNYEHAEILAKKLNIRTLPRFIVYSPGNMFWIRKEVMKTLLDLNLEWDDYPQEPLPINGTFLHAIEYFIGIATLHSNLIYETMRFKKLFKHF